MSEKATLVFIVVAHGEVEPGDPLDEIVEAMRDSLSMVPRSPSAEP